MTIKTVVTLSKEEISILDDAAVILEALGDIKIADFQRRLGRKAELISTMLSELITDIEYGED